jgi:hypothetical protein
MFFPILILASMAFFNQIKTKGGNGNNEKRRKYVNTHIIRGGLYRRNKYPRRTQRQQKEPSEKKRCSFCPPSQEPAYKHADRKSSSAKGNRRKGYVRFTTLK